ncbi:hypothetical protein HDU97_007284 [Phlyctochytrium planicorne]|nr:hypothetical protein HDU97_007284 [Phlyctochytrium planicorne]
MSSFRCPCLNLSIQAKPHDSLETLATPLNQTPYAGFKPASLGLGGVKMTGEDIDKVKAQPDFSEAFGLRIFDAPTSAGVIGSNPLFESVNITYEKYLDAERKKTEGLIKEFTLAQTALLDKRLHQAEHERKNLLAHLHALSLTSASTLTSSIAAAAPAVPDISVTSFTPPLPPNSIPNTTPKGSASSTPRKVHFVMSPSAAKDAGTSSPPAAAKTDVEDDMFELDEDEGSEKKKAYLPDVADDLDPVDDIGADDPPTNEDVSLSSSVPIGIPKSFRSQEGRGEGGADTGDDFVAPHIIVARSYTLSESLSGRPSPRKSSIAI